MLTIYTAGDAGFMNQILNAVAMTIQNISWASSVGIAFLLTIVTIVAQQFLGNGRIKFEAVTVMMVIYLVLFGKTVSVQIQNPNSGATYVVDNVPLGPAAAGAIVSHMGYSLTQAMQTNFSTPAMSQTTWLGGIEPLRIIRMRTEHSGDLGSALADTNIQAAWADFMAQCQIRSMGPQSGESFDTYQTRSLPNFAISWPGAPTTLATMYPANFPTSPLCSDSNLPSTLQNLTDQWAQDYSAGPLAAALGVSSGQAAIDQVDAALAAIGLGDITALQFIEASMVSHSYPQGAAWVAKNLWLDSSEALAISDAEAQRNASWNAEGFLFGSLVMSMMTVMECLLYGLTPIMAVLLMTGPQGWQAAIRWLQVATWMQLWNPIFAIVNFYISYQASSSLAPLAAMGVQALSLQWLLQWFDGTIQTQFAFADHVAAMVPMIAMMLVYGGQKAMQGMVESFGQGSYNAQKVAADTVAAAPLGTFESRSYSAANTGGQMASVEAIMPKITGRDTSSVEAHAAEVHAAEVTKSFGQSFAKVLSHDVSSGMGATRTEGTAAHEALTHSAAYQKDLREAQDLTKSLGISEQSVATDMASLRTSFRQSGSVDAQTPAWSIISARASVGIDHDSSGQASHTDSQSKQAQLQKALSTYFGQVKTESSTAAETQSREISDRLASTSGTSDRTGLSKEAREQDQDLRRSAQSVQEAYRQANSVEASKSVGGHEALEMYRNRARGDGGALKTAFAQATAGMQGAINQFSKLPENRAIVADIDRADPSGFSRQVYSARQIATGNTPAGKKDLSKSTLAAAQSFFSHTDTDILGMKGTVSQAAAGIDQAREAVKIGDLVAGKVEAGVQPVTAEASHIAGGSASLLKTEQREVHAAGVKIDAGVLQQQHAIVADQAAGAKAMDEGPDAKKLAGAKAAADAVDKNKNVQAAATKAGVNAARTAGDALKTAVPETVKKLL